jgi:pyridoxamine 5'-phosphate oxidase
VRPDGGFITFFTNYLSRKGNDLAANPRAAIVMHWDALRRQVRLEGRITRTTEAESDAYFSSRAWQSRIGAWASQQSAPIGSRAELEQAAERTAQRFGTPATTPRRIRGL